MKTKIGVMARLRQSIAKKKVWLEKSGEELSRIYSERYGSILSHARVYSSQSNWMPYTLNTPNTRI